MWGTVMDAVRLRTPLLLRRLAAEVLDNFQKSRPLCVDLFNQGLCHFNPKIPGTVTPCGRFLNRLVQRSKNTC